jgi:hypothetical protein
MTKSIAILLAAANLWVGSLAYAADFKGKVTKPDGVTPVANAPVYLYKYNPGTGNYSYYANSYTDGLGLYTVTTGTTGVYLVNFQTGGDSNTGHFNYAFSTYNYYYDNPLASYYSETYNDVTALTPTKAPTQFSVTNLTQVFNLALVKLNPNTTGNCKVTGPVTINGVPYSSFSAYGGGPTVPDAGGTLNLSFKVTNGTATAIATNVQALAFLTRRDAAGTYVSGANSVQPFARKAQTLPANATTTVTLSVAIPAALMTSSPTGTYGAWAFNLGIQMVTSNGVASCREFIFPIQHVPTAASAASEALAAGEAQAQVPDIIPLTLSEDGQVLEWGPAPAAE